MFVGWIFAITRSMSRILDNEIMGDEELVERTLRPQYLREYIGQDKVKDQLQNFLSKQQKMRDEALDHVLLFWSSRSRENNHGFCHC